MIFISAEPADRAHFPDEHLLTRQKRCCRSHARESSANLPRIFRESSPQAFIHTYSWKAGEWSLIVIARRFSAHVMPFSCAWLQPWCSRTPRSSCVEDSAKMHAYPVPLSACCIRITFSCLAYSLPVLHICWHCAMPWTSKCSP